MKHLFSGTALIMAVGLLTTPLTPARAGELDIHTLTCADFIKLGDTFAAMAISEADGFLAASKPGSKLTIPDDDASLTQGLAIFRQACGAAGGTLLDLMKKMSP